METGRIVAKFLSQQIRGECSTTANPLAGSPSAHAGQRVAMMMTSKLPYLRCIFSLAGSPASEPASRDSDNQSGILLQIRCE